MSFLRVGYVCSSRPSLSFGVASLFAPFDATDATEVQDDLEYKARELKKSGTCVTNFQKREMTTYS